MSEEAWARRDVTYRGVQEACDVVADALERWCAEDGSRDADAITALGVLFFCKLENDVALEDREQMLRTVRGLAARARERSGT